jgi:hypothetical protein
MVANVRALSLPRPCFKIESSGLPMFYTRYRSPTNEEAN